MIYFANLLVPNGEWSARGMAVLQIRGGQNMY
jgi:hypothetical protein